MWMLTFLTGSRANRLSGNGSSNLETGIVGFLQRSLLGYARPRRFGGAPSRRLPNGQREFWKTIRKPDRPLATRLTQSNKRETKGGRSLPKIELPAPGRLCPSCGTRLCRKETRLCRNCTLPLTRKNFDQGRKAAQRPEFLAKRSATQKSHKQDIRNWNPSDLPGW